MKTYDVILVTDTHGWTWFNNSRCYERGAGAHRIASHIRDYGYSVLVIDFSSYITFDFWKTICENAIGSNTLFIGFSTTWWPYRNPSKGKIVSNVSHSPLTNELLLASENTLTIAASTGNLNTWIDYAKQYNNKLKILLGGAKVASYFDVKADHFFIGLGETQIIDYLQNPKRIWPRVINHDPEALHNFNFVTSATKYTKESFIQPYETLGVEFARGCRFECSFCRYALIGRKDIAGYVKSSEAIYAELMDNYNKWGVTRYNILDDTFNDSTEKLKIVANAVKRLPFKPKFWSYTRVDMIHLHNEQISLLKEIGLVDTFMGIESFHNGASKVIGKGMNANKRKDTLYKCKEIWKDDITIFAGYIIGLPGESKEHIEGVAKWLKTPDCPIYFMTFVPLGILHSNELTQYRDKSKIDLNPEKYGYSFTNEDTVNENINAHWIKNPDDGTGISSWTEAQRLAKKLNTIQGRLKHSIGSYPNLIYDKKSFENPDWYFDLLLKEVQKENIT